MSFHGYKDVIHEGDTVILYTSFKSMAAVRVVKEKEDKKGEMREHIVQTSYGACKVADLIGKKFGTKVRLSRGHAFVLHPTPQLWTKTLPHRTQILYATDIATIIQQLDLKPGSVVIESGTGSGSLSHSLIRTIAPTGHLHTFDYHQNRVDVATGEFRDHGLSDFVTARQRDVCADGFSDGDLDGKADAVFLDLPHPWEAVPHAKKAIRTDKGGRLCSFSPCVEQVQKCISAMEEHGFKEIVTLECLIREFQVRKIVLPAFDPDRQALTTQPLAGQKRKHSPDSDQMTPVDAETGDTTKGDTEEKKDDSTDVKVEGDTKDVTEGDVKESDTKEETKEKTDKSQDKPDDITFYTGVPLTTMPGHTGYLTFATLSGQV